MKKILLIGLCISLILISGCQEQGELSSDSPVNVSLKFVEGKGSMGYEEIDCDLDYMFIKNNTILVNDGVDFFDIDVINYPVVNLKRICVEDLSEAQKDCLIGYLSTFEVRGNYVLTIIFENEQFFDKTLTKIRCDTGCRTILVNGTIVEGSNSIKHPNMVYQKEERCWK